MDDIIDTLLESFGIPGVKSYDDLRPDEQESYRKMLEIQTQSDISLEDVKVHIRRMRQAVEFEIANILVIDKKTEKQDMFLRARLRNYLLLEALFDRPQRAREMLTQMTKPRL